MADRYGSDFMTIMDEDGTEFELEVLSTIEYNGATYLAVIPADDSQTESEPKAEKAADKETCTYKFQGVGFHKIVNTFLFLLAHFVLIVVHSFLQFFDYAIIINL